jgi:hypothetical protein
MHGWFRVKTTVVFKDYGSLAIIRLSKFAFQAVYAVLECLAFVCRAVAGGKGDYEK